MEIVLCFSLHSLFFRFQKRKYRVPYSQGGCDRIGVMMGAYLADTQGASDKIIIKLKKFRLIRKKVLEEEKKVCKIKRKIAEFQLTHSWEALNYGPESFASSADSCSDPALVFKTPKVSNKMFFFLHIFIY